MTDPFDEYGDRLRRALNAQAESFQPSADGLERIRDRIEAKGTRIQIPWWRPTLAVGGALAILGAVVFSTPDLRDQALDAIAHVTERGAPADPTTGGGYPGGQPGVPPATGPGSVAPSTSPSVDPSTAASAGPETCPSSVPTFVTPTATATGAALLPTPTCSPEPTPSTTPTPTPSDTPTTDPSPSDPGGGGGGDATPQPDPTGTSSDTGGSGTDGTQSGDTLSEGTGTTSGTE